VSSSVARSRRLRGRRKPFVRCCGLRGLRYFASSPIIHGSGPGLFARWPEPRQPRDIPLPEWHRGDMCVDELAVSYWPSFEEVDSNWTRTVRELAHGAEMHGAFRDLDKKTPAASSTIAVPPPNHTLLNASREFETPRKWGCLVLQCDNVRTVR